MFFSLFVFCSQSYDSATVFLGADGPLSLRRAQERRAPTLGRIAAQRQRDNNNNSISVVEWVGVGGEEGRIVRSMLSLEESPRHWKFGYFWILLSSELVLSFRCAPLCVTKLVPCVLVFHGRREVGCSGLEQTPRFPWCKRLSGPSSFLPVWKPIADESMT